MRVFSKPKLIRPQLRFHNTLSGALEAFQSLSPGKVKIYNCGPTAYDRQHIGNLFPPLVANTLRRVLEAWGYGVLEVNNITDFGHISENEDSEDKMTKGLRREGLSLTLEHMRTLAEKYAALFFADLPLLGIDPERVQYPRASDYIEEQIALVSSLEQKGFAYRIDDGVYFDTSRFPSYGTLGNIPLEGLREGARVEEKNQKHTPYDFALWKCDAKIGWPSPWGLGFPGWHTECVSMIFKLLGKQIDVHMGGVDLIPTHHNNEIAQAEALTNKQFVRYWIHNAHITIEGKKISKSLGNTIYLSDIVERGFSPRALRYWFLTGHYRTPVNFTWGALEGAQTALTRLSRFFLDLPDTAESEKPDIQFMNNLYAALGDDLDTPKAIALVWKLVKDDSVSKEAKRSSLVIADTLLGLGFTDRNNTAVSDEIPEEVQKLLQKREEARNTKDFTQADALRVEIEQKGYKISDTAEGSTLERA